MLGLAELKSASIACGLASSASRAVQLEALKSFYLREALHFPFPCGPVLSLDLGLRNLAACVVQDRSVLRWEKFDLQLPEVYCPQAYAQHIGRFCAERLLPGFQGKFIFIERQRHRSGSMAGIFETIVRLAILEAQLHALLKDRFTCVAISPAAVARFHDLPVGKEKKSAAISKVKSIVESKENARKGDSHGAVESLQEISCHVPDDLFKKFEGQTKKDDLADSLLQALAGIAFRRNCREFFELKHPELLPNKRVMLS